MRLEAAVGGALFTASVLCSAAFGHEIAHGLHRRHAELHVQMKRQAPTPTATSQVVNRGDVFNARVWPSVDIPAGFTLAGGVEVTPIPILATESMGGSGVVSTSIAVQTAAADPAKWNTQADDKCKEAIKKLNGTATNPSGMAACYNVPFLDPNKGTFEAELRIFNVSMPTGDFVGVPANNMMVTFQYNSASLQSSDGTLPVKRSLEERQMVTPMQGVQTGGVYEATEVSIRKYIGQVNKGAFTPGMNQSDFKTLLIPQVSISARNPALGRNVSTPVSPTEASFVIGLFVSSTGSLTDPAFLLDKPAQKIEAAAQGLPTPYIVPGLSLGVFPTGLIVTSVWLLFFSLIVGLGTLGRMQFREQYRREFKAQMSGSAKRI